MHRRPIFILVAALCIAVSVTSAHAQIFDQGPVETREYRNPNLAPPVHDHGIETENMFGFTLGSDTDEAGGSGVALETVGRFVRRGGHYTAIGGKLEFARGFADDLSASLSLLGGYRSISVIGNLPNTNRLRFDGVGGEIRWRLLQRGPSPVGITLHMEPAFRVADEVSGQGGRGFASENKLIFDTALVPDRVFAAVNLIYDVEAFRPYGAAGTERASTLGVSGAMSVQVAPMFFLGGEMRYLRAYAGMGLNTFQGEALFAGPTLFWHATESAWVSLAFNAQLAGRAVGTRGGFDMDNFDRYALRFKIGMHF